MASKQVYHESIPDLENSTVYTPSSTSSSAAASLDKQIGIRSPLISSIPRPGSSFLIQSAMTGKVITFQQGRVVLGQLGGHNMTRWQCVENQGWLGFRDPASGMFLGYDENEELCCTVKKQSLWENFCVRQRPEGGYLLLMTHYPNWLMVLWQELRPIGVKVNNGLENLRMVEDWKSDAIVWQFVEV